jgi:hypothetical protein
MNRLQLRVAHHRQQFETRVRNLKSAETIDFPLLPSASGLPALLA